MLLVLIFTVGVAVACVSTLAYVRDRNRNLKRSETAGRDAVETCVSENADQYRFLSKSEMEILLRFDGPCGKGNPRTRVTTPALHFHQFDSEVFTVLRGSMGYKIGGTTGVLKAGDASIEIAAGIPHTFWLAGLEDCVVRVKQSGVQLNRHFFENMAGVFRDSSSLRDGSKLPSLLQLFVILDSAKTVPLGFDSMPPGLAKCMLKVGSIVGRIAGFQPTYVEYTTSGDVNSKLT